MKYSTLFFLCWTSLTFAADTDHLYVLPSPDHSGGLFHNMLNVLGFLDEVEQKQWINFEVNFRDKGHYYEPSLGENWWSYYFEPIEHKNLVCSFLLPLKRTKKTITSNQIHQFVHRAEHEFSREAAHLLISKYIRFRPAIEEEALKFVVSHFFTPYVIGIHYRGTDKMQTMQGYAQAEANMIGYDEVLEQVKNLSQSHPSFQIFIATDTQDFLDFMKKHFGEKIIHTQAMRSTDNKPLHYNKEDATYLYYYKQGKEAIVDCLVLSMCNELIVTESNLNLCASYLNPHIPVHTLK